MDPLGAVGGDMRELGRRTALAERNAAIIEASQWWSGADIGDMVGMSKAGVNRILEANRGYAPPSRRKGQNPPPIIVEVVDDEPDGGH